MRNLITALLIMCIIGALILAGCAWNNEPKDYEVAKIVYVRVSGDIDRTDVYVFESDLSLRHQVLAPAPDLSEMSEMPLAEGDTLDEERRTISDSAWQSIVDGLKRNDFMTIPEEVTPDEPGCDFPGYYIWLDTTNGSHLSGGYAAGYGSDKENKRFRNVLECIESAIDDEGAEVT